jgi:CRP/FNR family cyclic AMP-dependent transcriptional regulator
MPASNAPSPQRPVEELLARLSPPVRALAERGELRWFDADEPIVVEGDAGDEVYVLLEGWVQALSRDPNDRDLFYSHDIAGGYFGEMTLDGGKRSATVVAKEKTLCAVVTRRTVLQLVRDNPDFAIDLLMKVIERAREATKRSKSVVQENVYQRLKKTLESLAVPADVGSSAAPFPRTTPPVTHKVLASRIGASREMVSRVLKDMESGGYVRSETRCISILKALPRDW